MNLWEKMIVSEKSKAQRGEEYFERKRINECWIDGSVVESGEYKGI
jgi:hypothetical protein